MAVQTPTATQAAASLQARMSAIRGGQSRETTLIRELQKRIGSANWANWQMTRWTYYDYVRYAVAGQTELNFFANPLGTTDPVSTLAKTFEQTNVQKSRTFGQVYYILHQIRTHVHLLPKQRQTAGTIAFAAGTLREYKGFYNAFIDILQSGVLSIKLGQKDYFEIPQPFLFAPSGFGLTLNETAVAGTAAAGTAMNWILQQNPNASAVWNVLPQQLIEPEQTVEAKITWPNGTSTALTAVIGGQDARLNIGLLFDGYVVRPAQ